VSLLRPATPTQWRRSDIVDIDRPPLPPAFGCEHGGRFGSVKIERRNPSLQVLLKKPGKRPVRISNGGVRPAS
jgi:hypothetical protein